MPSRAYAGNDGCTNDAKGTANAGGGLPAAPVHFFVFRDYSFPGDGADRGAFGRRTPPRTNAGDRTTGDARGGCGPAFRHARPRRGPPGCPRARAVDACGRRVLALAPRSRPEHVDVAGIGRPVA